MGSTAQAPKVETLFRQEALNARQAQWLGGVRIGRRLSFGVVTVCALLIASAVSAFALWGEITRKARMGGFTTHSRGQISLAAPATGVLESVAVVEGESVGATQLLFVVSTERASASASGGGGGGAPEFGGTGNPAASIGARAAASLRDRRASLEADKSLRRLQTQQRTEALNERLRGNAAEGRLLDAEAALAASRVQLAQTSLARQQRLAAEGFVSDAQTQQKTEELMGVQASANATERSRAGLQRDARAIHAEITAGSSALAADLSQIERSLSLLAQESSENEARRQSVVLAPVAGVVTAVNFHVGQSVVAGQALATVLPHSEAAERLAVHLYAPSRTAGFVQVGQTVMMRYAPYPYQKFGLHSGVVTAVGATPINPQDLPQGNAQAILQGAQSNEPLYRITVKPHAQSILTYGQVQALKPGMALEADVLQDKRAIWEWVLEPVLAARANAQVRF